MQKIRKMKSYGNGFDHLESKETIRAFLTWWNERSFFPFDNDQEAAEPPSDKMAA